jgi:hypothetical protein
MVQVLRVGEDLNMQQTLAVMEPEAGVVEEVEGVKDKTLDSQQLDIHLDLVDLVDQDMPL